MIDEFGNERPILEELHEDEKKIHEDERNIRIAFLAIGLLFLIIIGVFYFTAQLVQRIESQKSEPVNIVNQLTPTPLVPSISPALKSTVAPSFLPSPLASSTPVVIIREVVKNVSVKDQYIPFGSGSNQTNDWADVAGLQADIDFGSYENIKEVRFEISVGIPTANHVYAVSPAIIYDKGLKTYRVQMKTQLQFLANLNLARIHIISE